MVERSDVRCFPGRLIPGSRLLGRLWLGIGSIRTHGNSDDKGLVVGQALAEDDYTLGCDFILANIFGMISAAHLDNHHNLAKLAIDGYVPQPDDVIGEE